MKRFITRLWVVLGLAFIILYGFVSVASYSILTGVLARCGDFPGYDQTTPAQFSVLGLDSAPYQMPLFEEVSFPSRDAGLTLRAFYIPAAAADAPTVIVVHGLSACRRNSASLLLSGMLHRAGYPVLALDLRNMGDSDADNGRQAMGTKEYRDVLAGVDWLTAERGAQPERIGLLGYSLGAATALIAAGELPGVRAVFLDSPFVDPNWIIDDVTARHPVLPLIRGGALLAGRLLSGDDILSRPPLAAIDRLAGTALFISHGGADETIPIGHSRALIAAAAAAGLPVGSWLVDEAAHVSLLTTQTAAYEARLTAFFDEAFRE